ncbi:MAG: hypothetical protein J7K64_03235, partial [Bacteroidales bacterium]|nr:hypothetical protein [Bacteroidales bacterium]
MKQILTLSTLLVFLFSGISYSQQPLKKLDKKTLSNKNIKVVHPTVIKKPIGFSISKPLRDAPIISDSYSLQNIEAPWNNYRDRKLNPDIILQNNLIIDPVQQNKPGWINNSKGINQNFAGQSSPYYPPDCSGTVGPNHYFQVVNCTYEIFNKTGTSVAGPSNLNTIFDSGLPGAGENDGDPIVLWDEQADRWFYVEFSLGTTNDYMLIAVSTTNDPTGTWYSWSYDVDDTPDYMKLGVWQDGYYMATNTGGDGDNDVYVFDRTAMINGDASPTMIAFDNPDRPSTFDGFHCILPLDNDGPWAPNGTPGQFITVADDGQGNANDELRIYELNTDWTTPPNSTFAMTQQLPVAAFDGNFTGNWENIYQPGTAQRLDAISTVLMFRAQYRNFSGTQKIVINHCIDVNGDGSQGAIRWYELENTGSGWSIVQQSTYNPDGLSRFVGSIAMNDAGQIALGYSVSDNSSVYPSIRFVGQSTCAPLNTMDIAETSIKVGANSQTAAERWGDYSQMSVDPSDGLTFWYTTEYIGAGGTRQTQIASFTLDEACAVPTNVAANPTSLYEDRGKQITVTGNDILGCTFTIGGVLGSIASNDGSTAVVNFPAGDYTNGTLTVENGMGNDTYAMTINTRDIIPVVSGSSAISDNHPTIQSAVNGLHAWYGTTAFNAGDLAGTKTIEVHSGTYTDEVTLNSELNPTAANPLIIQNNSGDAVTINATNNNYGFNLSTVDYVQLKGFTVDGADLDNIYAQGNNVTIQYNKTTGSIGGSGIKVETGTPFTVMNNLSYSNYKY